MADKSIGISLRDTFESRVLKGDITGDGSFWSGTIDSEKVHDGLVENPVKRQELKEAIISLEEYIKVIRQKGSPQLNNELFNLKIPELSNRIFDIITYHTDLELYLIYLIQKFDSIKENNPEEFKKINAVCKKQVEQNRRILLSGKSVCAYPVYIIGKQEYGFETELISEQEKQIKKSGNEERLVRFLNIIYGKEDALEDRELQFLDEVCDKLKISDLAESLFCPALKRLFTDSILKNYLHRTGMSREEIEVLPPQKTRELANNMFLWEEKEIYKQVLSDTLMTHLDYVSVDKIILAFLQRNIEEYNRSAQISFDFNEIFEESRILQDLIKRIVDSKIISNNASINMETENGNVNFNLRTIKRIQREFVSGVYLTPEIVSVMKDMLFRKQSVLIECDESVIKRLKYSAFDYEIISLVDFGNLQKLFELGIIDKSFVNRLVRNCSLDIYTTLQDKEDKTDSFNTIEFPNKNELISFLLANEIVDSKDLYEYYMLGHITLDELNQIKLTLVKEKQDNFYGEILNCINITEILKCYKEYSEKHQKLNSLKKLNNANTEEIELLTVELDIIRNKRKKLVELYKVCTSDRTNEEQIKKGNEIIDIFYIDLQVEDEKVLKESITSMYEDGFITIENIIYLSPDYIISMLDKLSFQDIDRIKASMSRENLLKMLDKIFMDESISENQKFIIIMNLFEDDKEEDKSVKKRYLKRLKKDGKEKKVKSMPREKDNDETSNSTTSKSKTYVYSDGIKWKFFRALDKDARVKKYSNGYVEFASKKFGVRFIEKYYDGEDLAYGTATCIVPEKVYLANSLALVTGDADNEVLEGGFLRKITPRKDRIHHRTHSSKKTWMEDIVKYLGIDLDKEWDLVIGSVYTREEWDMLRNVIKTYKGNYTEIEK